MKQSQVPLACDLAAIPADQRAAYHSLVRDLMAAASSVRDLPDGLVLEWPAARYNNVARFVELERRCCPFLTFTLLVSAASGPLTLRLSGPEGVVSFLRAELHLPA